MLVFDLHGYTGSAWGQTHSPWRGVGRRQNFFVVWPDGMHDSPNGLGSWNCSNTNGPKGNPCDIDRSNWKKFECYKSCPLCNEMNTCDWTSCHDDIGFIDFVMREVTDNFCIDLDHVHLSGMSNGGIFAYYLASQATDALGKNQPFNSTSVFFHILVFKFRFCKHKSCCLVSFAWIWIATTQ